MFIGHLAVAFGAKRAASSVSLGTLFVACQLADLVWPVLVVTGIECVTVSPGATLVTPLDFVYYPFLHSLAGRTGWTDTGTPSGLRVHAEEPIPTCTILAVSDPIRHRFGLSCSAR